MTALLRDLVAEVKEACADPRYARLKKMWTRHNRLEKVEKIPVGVHLHRGYPPAWVEIIPPETLRSQDPLERNLELQLRQKLYRHRHIPDDDVLLPTIWLEPVRPEGPARLWGVALQRPSLDDPTSAYTFEAVVKDESDLARMHYPSYELDATATQELVAKARELLDDGLPVKLYTDEVSQAPGEVLVQFLGWEEFLTYFIERPALVHQLMDFLTEGYIHYQLDREAKGSVDAEGSWSYRVHYEELPPEDKPDRLSSCWAYIAAQSTGIISPTMYAEFIQPYNERIARMFGSNRIYYHGCEDLTPKIDIIRKLPGLRRFHVSAWTDLAMAAEKFGRSVVLESHMNPGKTIMVDTPEEMRRDLQRMVDTAGHCIFEINLADIQTVKGDPSIITTWATIAQEVTSRSSRV